MGGRVRVGGGGMRAGAKGIRWYHALHINRIFASNYNLVIFLNTIFIYYLF